MAAGVPVVATKCGGPEEFIDDRQNGLLVDVGDYRSMAGAINTILDDPALGRRLAAEGRNRVSRCFDLDMQLETLFRVALPPVR
jgi:glycosyltransferase involved in cell wall biosynthesis